MREGTSLRSQKCLTQVSFGLCGDLLFVSHLQPLDLFNFIKDMHNLCRLKRGLKHCKQARLYCRDQARR